MCLETTAGRILNRWRKSTAANLKHWWVTWKKIIFWCTFSFLSLMDELNDLIVASLALLPPIALWLTRCPAWITAICPSLPPSCHKGLLTHLDLFSYTPLYSHIATKMWTLTTCGFTAEPDCLICATKSMFRFQRLGDCRCIFFGMSPLVPIDDNGKQLSGNLKECWSLLRSFPY